MVINIRIFTKTAISLSIKFERSSDINVNTIVHTFVVKDGLKEKETLEKIKYTTSKCAVSRL